MKAWAAFAASLSFYVTGEVRGWASPAVPSLQGFDGLNNSLSYAPLSKEAASWISKSYWYFLFLSRLGWLNFGQFWVSTHTLNHPFLGTRWVFGPNFGSFGPKKLCLWPKIDFSSHLISQKMKNVARQCFAPFSKSQSHSNRKSKRFQSWVTWSLRNKRSKVSRWKLI